MSCGIQDGCIQIALFGLGGMGQVHFENILMSRRARVTWVVEEVEPKAKEALRRMGQEDKVKVVNNAQADLALSDPRWVTSGGMSHCWLCVMDG